MKREKGFSLIELLIVVAIILIIAAIAIPNLLRARLAANEASAVNSVRTIDTSEIQYNATYAQGYATAISNLGGAAPCTPSAATACLVDDVLTAGQKSGYSFTANAIGTGNASFAVHANPVVPGQTGLRYFYSDDPGVIRFNLTAAATSSDPALSQ